MRTETGSITKRIEGIAKRNEDLVGKRSLSKRVALKIFHRLEVSVGWGGWDDNKRFDGRVTERFNVSYSHSAFTQAQVKL